MPARFFYGWVIVAASFVILTVAYGVQFSYGVFLPHIMADLEIDRVSATAPFSLYILLYTILGFFPARRQIVTDHVSLSW